MLDRLQSIKTRIEEAKRATRDDIHEALVIIRSTRGADEVQEITELVEGIYNADQTAKLITSLDSYV